jgi:hypothetical protein
MNNQNKGEAMEAKVIKTAQQRAESDGWQVSMEQYRREEIADLRAALASAQEEIAGLREDAEYNASIVRAMAHDWARSYPGPGGFSLMPGEVSGIERSILKRYMREVQP